LETTRKGGEKRMKQTKQIVKDLIEQGIVNPDEIAKRSGLSKNRVYELRKELGYSKKQLKKLGLQEKKQSQAKQVNNPVIQEPIQKPQEENATTESPQTAINGAEKPNLEDVRYFIPNQNGDHRYVERRIGKRTDMEILEALYKAKIPTLIIGETGCGKTHFVHHFCFTKRLPLYRVNLNGSTTPEHLIGRWTPTPEGGFRWTDGILTTFVRHGGIILIDELNSANAEILFCLNSLLDDDRQICLIQKDGEVVKAHKDFFLVACINPDYEGTKPLNLALKDRFEILKFDYDDKVESKLVKDENMLAFAKKVRALYKEGEMSSPLSTRTLMRNDKLTETFGKEIADMFLINKFENEDAKGVEEVLTNIFRKKKSDDKKKEEVVEGAKQ
jgi:MoxR-like ATPase